MTLPQLRYAMGLGSDPQPSPIEYQNAAISEAAERLGLSPIGVMADLGAVAEMIEEITGAAWPSFVLKSRVERWAANHLREA